VRFHAVWKNWQESREYKSPHTPISNSLQNDLREEIRQEDRKGARILLDLHDELQKLVDSD
jgi:hypothetical protein